MPVAGSAETPPTLIRDTAGPAPARPADSGWIAVGLAGVVVGVFAAAGHESLTTETTPHPVGLYVAVIGAAVAALWLIARAFAPPS